MFKGHTDIILTDVRTGEETVYSDDNLVTKALEEYLKPCGNLANNARNQEILESYFNTLLGGVLLLKNTITENVNTIVTPAGNQMIGCGSYNVANSSAATELGSYDTTESGFLDDVTYRHVWDWADSQAVGQIGCVCLTSAPHGFIGEGNETSHAQVTNISGTYYDYWAYHNSDGEYYQRCFEDNYNGIILRIEDDFAYVTDTSEWTSSSITVHKILMPIENLDVRASRNKIIEVDSFTCTVNNAPSWFVNKSFRGYGQGVIVHDNGTIITLTMGEDTDYALTSKHVMGIVFDSNWDVTLGQIDNTSVPDQAYTQFGVNGKLLILYANRGTIYDILTGMLTTVDYDSQTFFTSDHWGYGVIPSYLTKDGTAYLSDGVKYDPVKNKLMFVNTASDGPTNGGSCILDSQLAMTYPLNTLSDCRHFRAVRFPMYIATINNLQTPIVKDSLHALKVVYTLRFDDE